MYISVYLQYRHKNIFYFHTWKIVLCGTNFEFRITGFSEIIFESIWSCFNAPNNNRQWTKKKKYKGNRRREAVVAKGNHRTSLLSCILFYFLFFSFFLFPSRTLPTQPTVVSYLCTCTSVRVLNGNEYDLFCTKPVPRNSLIIVRSGYFLTANNIW